VRGGYRRRFASENETGQKPCTSLEWKWQVELACV